MCVGYLHACGRMSSQHSCGLSVGASVSRRRVGYAVGRGLKGGWAYGFQTVVWAACRCVGLLLVGMRVCC